MLGLARQSTVRRLEERLEKCEAELRTANLDWDELYQKCRKLMGRTVKERASIEAHTEEKEPAPLPFETRGNGVGQLTERQKQIQQQILRRRAGG